MNNYEILKWAMGVLFALFSIGRTIRHFKITRTISYIERFNSPGMIAVRESIANWEKLPTKEQLDQLKNDAEFYQKVRLIYSIITEISLAYQKRIISRKLCCMIFDPLVPEYWESLKIFIAFQHDRGYPLGYSFHRLNRVILESRNKRYKRRRVAEVKAKIVQLKEELDHTILPPVD